MNSVVESISVQGLGHSYVSCELCMLESVPVPRFLRIRANSKGLSARFCNSSLRRRMGGKPPYLFKEVV